MRKFFLFFAILLYSGVSFGQVKTIDFQEYNLDNGLHVILHQNNTTPVVAINVTYHVGSKNEDSDRTGFAHFFEHLMFEGSENIGRGEFFKYIQNAGGKNNAFTTQDRTVYFEVLPSNQLKLGLWLESERMMHAKINKEGVETQRTVVKEERNQRIDNQPYGSIMEETFSHAYKKHPYRWTPIGSDQYIDQAKLEEFMDFYNTYYVPNNAVLVIAGDIDIDQTKKWIKEYFGPIHKGTKKMNRPDIVEPKQTKEIRDTVYDNIQLPALIEAYHIPAQNTKDFYALDMLNKLLSGGKSSRLYESLVDEKQLAHNVAAFPYPLEDPGLYFNFAIANINVDLKTLEKAMDSEIDKVKTDEIPDKEFEKLQNQTEDEFYTQNNQMISLAQNLAEYYLFFGDTNLINTEINKYKAVTKEDLKRVANKYLTKENRVVLYYLPEPAN